MENKEYYLLMAWVFAALTFGTYIPMVFTNSFIEEIAAFSLVAIVGVPLWMVSLYFWKKFREYQESDFVEPITK